MVAVIAGLVLALVAVLLWVGVVTIAHALAIFMGVVGVALILWYAAPLGYRAGRRQVP